MWLSDHRSLLRVYMTARSSAPIESVFSASCTESQYTSGRCGQVVRSTACLTLSPWLLLLLSPFLLISFQSLSFPGSMCLPQAVQEADSEDYWVTNVIGLFSHSDMSRGCWSNWYCCLSSHLVCISSHVYMCTRVSSGVSLCACVDSKHW